METHPKSKAYLGTAILQAVLPSREWSKEKIGTVVMAMAQRFNASVYNGVNDDDTLQNLCGEWMYQANKQ